MKMVKATAAAFIAAITLNAATPANAGGLIGDIVNTVLPIKIPGSYTDCFKPTRHAVKILVNRPEQIPAPDSKQDGNIYVVN